MNFGSLLQLSRRFSGVALVDSFGPITYRELARLRVDGSAVVSGADDRYLLARVAARSSVVLVPPGFSDSVPRVRGLTFLTTGTTGAPKPVTRRRFHPGQVLPALSLLRALDLRRGEPVLLLPPLHHGHGFSVAAACLLVGAPIIIGRASTALALAELHKPGVVVGVPAQLAVFASSAVPVRRFVSGSGPLSAALASSLLAQADVVDFYGTTETGTLTVARADSVRLGSVGRPVRGVGLRVVDGVVFARSPLAASRGWIPTGDRGHLVDGRLYLTGRTDDIAVIGGENVSLGLLASYLRSQQEIEDAVVAVTPDERFGSVLEVSLVLVAPLTVAQVCDRVLRDLGRAYVPGGVEVVGPRIQLS